MKLMTAKEYADATGIHIDTVYRLGRDNKIPTVKIGGSTRFYPPTNESEDKTNDTTRKNY